MPRVTDLEHHVADVADVADALHDYTTLDTSTAIMDHSTFLFELGFLITFLAISATFSIESASPSIVRLSWE